MTEPITCIPATLKRKITGIEDIPGDLIETLQELISRLTVLGGVMQSGLAALRVILITGSTTAVTGSLTSAGTVSTVTTVTGVTTLTTLTNFGTGYPAQVIAQAQSNLTAILGNINNVTPA